MTDYIETRTKDGVTIRIEVENAAKATTGFGGRSISPTNVSGEAAGEAYSRVLQTIRACAGGFIETLQDLEAAPQAASFEFAIKVDGEAGAMVAKSLGEAQFKVSLSWKKVKPEDKDDD